MQRGGSAKVSQNAKRKMQKSKPGVRCGGAVKENPKAKVFRFSPSADGRHHLAHGVRSCERINNLTQRRQGAKTAKNNFFVFFAPLWLCAFA
jgi:hypothetical protein